MEALRPHSGHLYPEPVGLLRDGIDATKPAAVPMADPTGPQAPQARPIAAPEARAGTVSIHLYELMIRRTYWIHSVVS